MEGFGLACIGSEKKSLVDIAQSWLYVTQTMRWISFWKESISFILKELYELEEGVKVR